VKIIACTRTRNEAENIGRFCQSYAWADQVLVADGGSLDNTKEIAAKYENVKIRDYHVYVDMDNGIHRNPHGSHLNFLIDWAFLEEKADWIIMDDADCFPNKFVRENARMIMENTKRNFVYITRLYLWKDQGHFPQLAKPNKSPDYVPSIWAWKRGARMKFRSDQESRKKSHQELAFIPPKRQVLNLMPPYALLHCPWQTEEMVQRKLAFYRNSGEVPNMKHPLEFGGVIEPLPIWAVE
jgi:glycosyltransferase involved in cell wall biosynthesis